MASPEFSIPAGELDAAGKQYLFPVRAAWIRGVLEDGEATAAGPDGELDVRASKSGTDVVIHGTLRAQLQAPCARCLEPVQLHIDHPVSVLMVPTSHQGPSPRAKAGAARQPSGDSGDDYEFAAEEADTLPFDGQTVLLDDLVRDELVLDVPMIPLCSDDCPGMRPPPQLADTARGIEDVDRASSQSVDPRLLPLLRFQSKVKKE